MSLDALHPRPQLQRGSWVSLDGWWQFSADPGLEHCHPKTVEFSQNILVPYAPESPRSGIQDETPHHSVWYRTHLTLDSTLIPGPAERLILHFGAVDHEARIWINGEFVGEHIGGYTPFSLDITEHASAEMLDIAVQAKDHPQDMSLPRGKQDWLRESHSIWYPRTTGIWRTVWLEKAPAQRIEKIHWTPSVERFQITYRVVLSKPGAARLRVRLYLRGELIAEDTSLVKSTDLKRTICLSDPGIDDVRDDYMWSPEHPQLIDAELALLDENGNVLDEVTSYTALRSVEARDNLFYLNGRPYYLRLVLDQGYWTQGHATASPEELRRDVELTKQLGFNGVRKHQKIEDPRFLYHADRMGLLVWTEMPSPYAFTPEAIDRVTREWLRVIDRDYSHPCVVAWVTFNESWGVPDLPLIDEQRQFVKALYHLTHAFDPTRPVIGNDGWEHVVTDIFSIHDYEARTEVIERNYADPQILQTFMPGRRKLLVGDAKVTDQPYMLTEFGGIAYTETPQKGWGYSTAQSSEDFIERYEKLLAAVHDSPVLSGFCYTQLTDTFQEINGVLDMDRRPKAPIERFAKANKGNKMVHADPNPLQYSPRWLKKQPQTESATSQARSDSPLV
ncbi:glycoside hydrolase family 2 protein [Deinococcus cellulosilyticus]|uniref:Beta-glucuronidase n=1 Tax=Deinococcus cellulosilyticus (strain DSM 18568 / NBRC 106333 / KACC 11606 / 5516J-15) TaxID=1223518 RepID=A0A511MZN0_DEIC1|nr:glycoside hydrolase family 2 TIM barrel-domain containing protein [Deinococcus cellulosilyticus]GEM46033.1 beta-glucuronidase [Deinococcus cellulosilyticus NBRC 106333 = KACC 11606]